MLVVQIVGPSAEIPCQKSLKEIMSKLIFLQIQPITFPAVGNDAHEILNNLKL